MSKPISLSFHNVIQNVAAITQATIANEAVAKVNVQEDFIKLIRPQV